MSKKNRHFTCEFKEYLQLDSVHQDFKLGSFTAIDFFMFNYGLKLSIEDLICTIIIKKGGAIKWTTKRLKTVSADHSMI